jgi:hypothetical protein
MGVSCLGECELDFVASPFAVVAVVQNLLHGHLYCVVATGKQNG